MMSVSMGRRLGMILFTCLFHAGVSAQDASPLTVTAAYTVESDQTGYPAGTVTDQVGKAELGLLFHTLQGLQSFDVDAHFDNYQYQTETDQDHTEANYTAAWKWAVTPRLTGNVDAMQAETPRASAIYGPGPNRQTQTHYSADAQYEVDGPWHVIAGVSQDKHSSQYTDPSNPDTQSNSEDLGLRYDFSSGSWIRLSVISVNGNYLSDGTAAFAATGDSYRQLEEDLRLHWLLRADTSADAYITQINRTDQYNTQLNFSGFNYGANGNWAITQRSSLVAGYLHELSIDLEPAALFTTRDALNWGVNWQIGNWVQLQLRQTLEQLGFRVQPGDSTNVRQDSSHDTSLALVWMAGRRWQVSAAVQQQEHSSTLAGQGYTGQQISLSTQLSF